MKKIILVLLLFLNLNSVFASSEKPSEEKYCVMATDIIEAIMVSKNETKREGMKNKLIKCFNGIPKFKVVFEKVYSEKREQIRDDIEPVYRDRFIEIGSILGIK